MGLNCSAPADRKRTEHQERNRSKACFTCFNGSEVTSTKHTSISTPSTTPWHPWQPRDNTSTRNSNPHALPPADQVIVHTPQQVLQATQRIVLKHFACVPAWAVQPPPASVCYRTDGDLTLSTHNNIVLGGGGGGTDDGAGTYLPVALIHNHSHHSHGSHGSAYITQQHTDSGAVQGDVTSDLGHRDTACHVTSVRQPHEPMQKHQSNGNHLNQHVHAMALDSVGPAVYDDDSHNHRNLQNHQNHGAQQAFCEALCGLDPVVVATLCLIHSQGRQTIRKPTNTTNTNSDNNSSVRGGTAAETHRGLSQLSQGVIEWLSTEVGYDVYGTPPNVQQLEEMDCGLYFCAALCQTLQIYISRVQHDVPILPKPTHTTGQAIIRTLYQLLNLPTDSTTCPQYARNHSLPTATITPPLTTTSPQTFISARWGSLPVAPQTHDVEDAPMSDTTLMSEGVYLDAEEAHAQRMQVLVAVYRMAADKEMGKQLMMMMTRTHVNNTTHLDTLMGVTSPCWVKFNTAHTLIQRLATALAIRADATPPPPPPPPTTTTSGPHHKRPSPRSADSDVYNDADDNADVDDVDHDVPVVMYICGAGDTVASVAAAVDLSEDQVLDANPGLREDPCLRPCDCLALPVASVLPRLYCMQPTDSLLSVSNHLSVTLHRLMSCNPSVSFNPRTPQPGWLLEVPGEGLEPQEGGGEVEVFAERSRLSKVALFICSSS